MMTAMVLFVGLAFGYSVAELLQVRHGVLMLTEATARLAKAQRLHREATALCERAERLLTEVRVRVP